MSSRNLHVGIVGGGLGGLAAAIAMARAGAKVTVLEAAAELGEIGAGIQMFGNVSRFLIRWGVSDIIGDNLVQMDELRTWGHGLENKMIGRVDVKEVVKAQGFPWWVVRRDHLHAGLAEGARRHGVNLIINARVKTLDSNKDGVTVTTEAGCEYSFDLVLGADGIKSTVRSHVFPGLVPRAASNVAAYRAVVPYEEVYSKIPEARFIIGNTMDAWVGPGGYVLLYPLTACRELNVVTAFEQDRPVTTLEEVNIQDFRDHYKDWDPFIKKILNLVRDTKRWPLNVVPPAKTWSNDHKNIVLMGDAAHGMQNHMAQGAATAMEDGVFLARTISDVVRGHITLQEAVHLYEVKRMPRAWTKQQSAFIKGQLCIVRGEEKRLRDLNTAPEIQAWDRCPANQGPPPPTYRTWQLMASPETVPGILYYDAEGDADFAVCEYLQNKQDMDPVTMVSEGLKKKWYSSIYDNGVKRWENRIQAGLTSKL